ncbi:MAG: hypothetical protein ACI8UQ_001395 [Bacteroidia bacterium]
MKRNSHRLCLGFRTKPLLEERSALSKTILGEV